MRDKLRCIKNLKKKERAKLNDEPVIVKFSRCYGRDAHCLLAAKQLVPEIVSVETLPGGWRAIVMKKIVGEALPLTLDGPTKSSLKEAADTLHNGGFVHGDLRHQNY